MSNSRVTLNPIDGELVFEHGGRVNFKSDDVTIELSYTMANYQEKFETKQQALHDIVEDGDGIHKEEIADLVLVANKAVWQGE